MPDFLETTVDKFIFKVATDRAYSSRRHLGAGGRARCSRASGDFRLPAAAQRRHGLRPPEAGREQPWRRGDEFAEIETIKATTSFPSPVAGKIVESQPQP